MTQESIDDVLRHHAALTPNATCLMHGEASWTYSDVDALVERVAARWRALGLRRGDRIAVHSTPRPEYVALLLGIARAGGVFVGLNPRYTAPEIAHVARLVAPRALVSLREFEGASSVARIAESATMAPVPVPVYFDSMSSCIEALDGIKTLASCAPAPDAATMRALDRTAAIVFTSGSTGRPKAAMLTHAGLLFAARVQHERLDPPAPRYLCNLPINHVGGIMNLTLAALVGGGSLVFQERFDAAQALALLRNHQVTTWLQVPAMFHACVNHPHFDPAALGHLARICVGGGALARPLIERLRMTGARVTVEYGQTETSSSAAYSDDDAPDDVLAGTIGRFEPRFDFRIADAAGRGVQPGDVGEIQGRGTLLFAGYFGDEYATRAAFTEDGWLRTGDLARYRDDGNVVLEGRLSELVKSGGYNVYPREVEAMLESHPAVSQVVVIGMPDERFGERVEAVLQLHRPISAPTLDAWCRTGLANYKVPKAYRVASAFPLLPNGKIDRRRVREIARELPSLEST
jgi:acyl-CoA synthetase (AMP-forming)/AMP-acid ligase II